MDLLPILEKKSARSAFALTRCSHVFDEFLYFLAGQTAVTALGTALAVMSKFGCRYLQFALATCACPKEKKERRERKREIGALHF